MTPKRKSLGKKIRFEVFKRDSFTCQYCGAKAPDVILHADHIVPVIEGGADDITNLVTSCDSCNLGKGATRLTDDSIVEKKRKQLLLLQSRREQIEMMYEWEKGLLEEKSLVADKLAEFLEQKIEGYCLTRNDKALLDKIGRRFGLEASLQALDIAVRQYLKQDQDGELDQGSIDVVLSKVGGIAYVRKRCQEDPTFDRLNNLRKAMFGRYSWVPGDVMRKMQRLVDRGASIELLEDIFQKTRNWYDFRDFVSEQCQGAQ